MERVSYDTGTEFLAYFPYFEKISFWKNWSPTLVWYDTNRTENEKIGGGGHRGSKVIS
jgi:hypothetical protein